jgi:hypothetical protein
LIRVVVAHGGDLLKFAGDAFIVAWRADDDAGMPPGSGAASRRLAGGGAAAAARGEKEAEGKGAKVAPAFGAAPGTKPAGATAEKEKEKGKERGEEEEDGKKGERRLAAAVMRAWQCCAQVRTPRPPPLLAHISLPSSLPSSPSPTHSHAHFTRSLCPASSHLP